MKKKLNIKKRIKKTTERTFTKVGAAGLVTIALPVVAAENVVNATLNTTQYVVDGVRLVMDI